MGDASKLGAMRKLLERVPTGLVATIDDQFRVVSRGQLNAAGIDDMAISRRVRNGEWQRVLPATYVLGAGALSTEQRRVAAALYAGGRAQLTGATALLWYGFRYVPVTDSVHVLVPHDRRLRSTGFVIVQRALELDPAERATEHYRLTSPARAVVDLCRQRLDLRTTRAVMGEAVQRSFTTLDELEAQIRRAARSRTAVVRQAMRELCDGVRSAPEAELRALLETSKILPRPLWNPALRAPDGGVLPTPDGYLVDAAMALEVDSRDHHADPDGWARTLRRHNALSQYGVIILHFTPRDIRQRPGWVLDVAERTYLSRIAAGVRADVVVVSTASVQPA
jgi:hypothetical protein